MSIARVAWGQVGCEGQGCRSLKLAPFELPYEASQLRYQQ